MRKLILRFAAFFAFAVASSPAISRAGDFFNLTANGENGTTVSENNSNLINLVDNLINTRSQFRPLLGQNFNASLTYGGVPNALLFSENVSQTSATITIPATGFTETFTGNNAAAVQRQITDFIKKNGAGEYAAFTRAINRESPVATVDGNPEAFTEFVATDVYERYGFSPTLSHAPKSAGSNGDFRVDAAGGYIRAAGLDGSVAELSLDSEIRFTSHVALSFGTALQYRNIGGSQTYFVAQEVGLPITIFNQRRRDTGLSWQLTPWVFGGIGASSDQVDGAVIVGGGGTSSLSYQLSDFTFTLADQLGYTSGIPVGIDGYSFDTYVTQWVLKNGGKITYAPGRGPVFIEGGISYSNLLHHGAIPDYWTPELGVGFKFGRFSGIKLDYTGNFAKKYSENGGRLTFYLSY